MRLFQKIIFISTLIVASIYFIFTLSFSSGWALAEEDPFIMDFYNKAQVANKLMYDWGFWALVFAGINILIFSHKNHKFYLLNYLCIIGLAITLIGSGVVTIDNVMPLKDSYQQLDKFALRILGVANLSKYSTDIFDYGFYLSIVMFVISGLIIIFTLIKTVLQIKRAKIKKLRRLENAHENL